MIFGVLYPFYYLLLGCRILYAVVLKDKTHPDFKEIAQWFNKKYSIEYFDKEKVNRKLKGLDKYIRKWIGG